jgi:hypothetical protein
MAQKKTTIRRSVSKRRRARTIFGSPTVRLARKHHPDVNPGDRAAGG